MRALTQGSFGRTASGWLAALVVLSGLMSAVTVSAQETAGASASTRLEYRLGPGDKVRVIVFGHEDLSGEFQIDGAGIVALPLIGGVRVGGKTLNVAESAIVAGLKPDYLKNPRVSLQVLNYRPFYIIGEVNKPGSYPYVNGITVLEAVAIAGGFTYRAKENKMKLTRATDPARKKQDATPETVILPGDVIEVPERFF